MRRPVAKAKQSLASIEKALRLRALDYPGSHEEFPWGERAIKVKGKIFVVIARDDGELRISVKLPQSRDMAHDLPFAEPTHYGLGKHGWVTAHLRKNSDAPLSLLMAWIDESYRAVAPKRTVAKMDAKDARTRPRRSRTESDE